MPTLGEVGSQKGPELTTVVRGAALLRVSHSCAPSSWARVPGRPWQAPLRGPGVSLTCWDPGLTLPSFEAPLYVCPGLEAGGGCHGQSPGRWETPSSYRPEHPCLPLVPQGPVCTSAKLRLAERRQQRLREVQAKHEHLCGELAETQGRLMLEPGRWLEQCEFPGPGEARLEGP